MPGRLEVRASRMVRQAGPESGQAKVKARRTRKRRKGKDKLAQRNRKHRDKYTGENKRHLEGVETIMRTCEKEQGMTATCLNKRLSA